MKKYMPGFLKFAFRLNEDLLKLGMDSDIAKEIDPLADINYHLLEF